MGERETGSLGGAAAADEGDSSEVPPPLKRLRGEAAALDAPEDSGEALAVERSEDRAEDDE